ncbi:S8 family serine peptidase [Candidatus Uhrbacteria bacterium]|nr:S8 family serine peptidase [Candidatus Uhrbacteria bacterium]
MRRFTSVRKTAIAICAAAAAFFPFAAGAAGRIPNDPYFSGLWYLGRIGAPEAWQRTLGYEGVPIAIIDSGVDIDHPDLRDNIWRNTGEIGGDDIDNDRNGYVDDIHGWDFVDNDSDPRPSASGAYSVLGMNHGTIGAGVAAAKGDNGQGIVGVTWQSAIMPIRALDSDGAGETYRVVQAVEYAVKNGAKVISLSFAGATESDLLKIALRRAYDAGVFVVAAAGNADEGSDANDLDRNPLFPICLDRDSDENFIFGVAATDEADHRARFSNYGAGCVDISAPGTKIVSTQLYRPGSDDFKSPYGGFYNGTSVSAPMVAGVVALIKSINKNLTPKQIANFIISTSDRIDDINPGLFGKLGRGRINAFRAVEAAAAGGRETLVPVTPTASLLPPSSRRLIVAAPGRGREPEIRFFTEDGLYVRGFMAFDSGFRGGVSLAVANFDGSAKQTVVASALAGGAPQIRIFDVNTRAIGGFFAFDQNFRGGVSVAVGDLDGDGKDEIIAGAGPGGGPHVRVFRPDGTPIGGFFAYDKKFRGGVVVSAVDADGDGIAEIGVAPASGGAPTRVFTLRGALVRETPAARPAPVEFRVTGKSSPALTVVGAATMINVAGPRSSLSFPPYGNAFRGGVRVGLIDVRL